MVMVSEFQRDADQLPLHNRRDRKGGRPSRRRDLLRGTIHDLKTALLRRRLPILLVAAVAALTWRFSERRRQEMAIVRISCSSPESWRYWNIPDLFLPGSAFFTEQEWFSPAASSAQSAPSRISILQACEVPYRHSQELTQLLQNHRGYAQRNGYEYNLWTGQRAQGSTKERGTWSKIQAVQYALQAELAKPAKDRLEWIFHTDADTLIVNPNVALASLLPPETEHRPYLLIARDHNAINAGVFLMRVNKRSLKLLDDILQYPRHGLRWQEQSVLIKLINSGGLEEKGDVAVLPASFFNSYDGRSAYEQGHGHSPVFQLHFPSKRFKRLSLLPILRDLHIGTLSKNGALAFSEADTIARQAAEFWMEWQRQHPL